MPIEGIVQPEILPVSDTIRLRRYDGNHEFALAWYQDPDTVYLVDGVHVPYDAEKLGCMYRYLDLHGELYWIEQLRGGEFVPIGDVTFWQDDMPIVIGDPACRGMGIGRQVIRALIARGRKLGYQILRVQEIYRWNDASRRMFTACGFVQEGETAHGHSYTLTIR